MCCVTHRPLAWFLLIAGAFTTSLLLWCRSQAQTSAPAVAMGTILTASAPQGFGGGAVQQQIESPRIVYLKSPVTAQAARTWLALQKVVDVRFKNETPFEDVIKFIREATATESAPNGIPVYVDPAGLLEAEKTMQSPISMELDGMPLATTLRIMLKQLELAFVVLDDGLLQISYAGSEDMRGADAAEAILEELKWLREEVRAMRTELRSAGIAPKSMAGRTP